MFPGLRNADSTEVTTHLLDNIVWHALTGAHARFADGSGAVRRYARGYSPIVGFADPARPDFDALRAIVDVDEAFYCDGWGGPVPAGWRVDADTTMYKMIYDGDVPPSDEAPEAVALGESHREQVLELVTLTRPGPFGPRTIELGDYFGIVEDGRLLAMAGERFQAGTLHEISGVCTHPDHQGRSLARRLMRKLIRRQMARGEIPVLHVISNNAVAYGLYERMGFRVWRESPVRMGARAE